jgi:hypothetical protein
MSKWYVANHALYAHPIFTQLDDGARMTAVTF